MGGSLSSLSAGSLSVASALVRYTLVTLVQLGPFDALLRFLERRPYLGKAFSLSFTKDFPRYIAPGFKTEPPRAKRSARDFPEAE